MFEKVTWYSLLILAVAGLAMFSSGFYKSLQITGYDSGAVNVVTYDSLSQVEKQREKQGRDNSTEASASPKNPNEIAITVMGDSIAYGTGDEKGKGFSTYLPDYLKSQTAKEISVENIGINGLKSAQLLEELRSKNLDPLMTSSDIILISIGGNDIRSIRSQDTLTKEEEFKELESDYLNSLKEIISLIRNNSPNSYIVFIGLYNPYQDVNASMEDTKLLNTWNYDTQKLIEADSKAVFIPTYDIFKFNIERFVAPDGLHPNAAGYQVISSRIAKSIENIFNKK